MRNVNSRFTIRYMISNYSLFVLRVGLEPTRPCGQGILSPSCLPFHHQSFSPLAISCWLLACVDLLSGKRDSNSRPRPWQGRALPTELFPQSVLLSGKRDSNSRPRPWQGRALPTELFPHRFSLFQVSLALYKKDISSFGKRVQKYKLFSIQQNFF